MNNNKIVKFWRGTKKAYDDLKKNNQLDYWTRYSVKETDNVWIEYFGNNRILETIDAGTYQ